MWGIYKSMTLDLLNKRKGSITMMLWLSENLASIVLLLVVAAIVFLIVRRKLQNRKQGRCSCGCEGCSGCAAHKKGGKV